MWRRIRRFYWYKRDRGRGRQTIVAAMTFLFFMIVMIGLITRNTVSHIGPKSGVQQETVTGSAVVTKVAVSESAVTEETMAREDTPKVVSQNIPVDTSDLDTFLGFMSETAYRDLENQVVTECQNRKCSFAKKLTYQKTDENSYEVSSFILLSDGSVFECRYNLKSCAVTFSATSYTEADVNQMRERQLQAEQEELKKQQKAEKKKLAKEKVAKKKKAKYKKKTVTKRKKKNGKKK